MVEGLELVVLHCYCIKCEKKRKGVCDESNIFLGVGIFAFL
jgi:hypothetical protein